MDAELETGLDADEPAPERNLHHPGPHRARRVVRPLADRHHRPVRVLRRVHRRRHRVRHARRHHPRREAGAGVADHHAARPHARVRRRARCRRTCSAGAARRTALLVPQTDLAILNWRREKSVFLGTNQPQEDASWIFQLRMAELERAKSGRTSEPRPWQRLAARTSTTRSGDSCSRSCCPSCAAWASCRRSSRSGSGIRSSRRCSSPAPGCRSRRCSSRPSARRRASGCSACSCSSRSRMPMRDATRARNSIARCVAPSACGGRGSAAASRCWRRC